MSYVLRVGEPYDRAVRHWPEGGEYNYREGAHELLLRFAAPTPREVEAVTRGPAGFGLLGHGDAAFLLYRFGDAVPWCDAPYSWWLVPEGQRTEPAPPGAGLRALLQVVLIDVRGIVRGLRALTWSPEFTEAVHAAIRGQIARGRPDAGRYNRQILEAYERWPTSAAMARATPIHCVGGQ